MNKDAEQGDRGEGREPRTVTPAGQPVAVVLRARKRAHAMHTVRTRKHDVMRHQPLSGSARSPSIATTDNSPNTMLRVALAADSSL